MSGITSTHTAIHLIEVPPAVSLIVVESTGRKFVTMNTAPGAVSARLQAGCAAPRASAPTATDLKSSTQRVVLREVKPRARESRPKPFALIAQSAPRTGSGPMRRSKGRISAMCAED